MARVPWAASELSTPARPPSRILWLGELPRPLLDANPVSREPSAPPELANATPPSTPRPAVPPPRRRASPQAPTPAVRPEPPAPAPAVEDDLEPPAAAAEQSRRPPEEVDWEKERHDAVASVIEERARRRAYLTFSLDDVFKEPKPIEPVLPPLVVDHCVVYKNKLQRFAALMTGRCVREARGDLFALLKPTYLKSHPVCIETRPQAPGSFLSDGTEVSTVKCELVANEDE